MLLQHNLSRWGGSGSSNQAAGWWHIDMLWSGRSPIYASVLLCLIRRAASLPQDCWIRVANSARDNFPRSFRARNTRSTATGNSVRRKVSRTMRLTLLRATAVGTFFLPITKPKRDVSVPLGSDRIRRLGWATRTLLLSKTSLKSEELSKRRFLPKVALGTSSPKDT